MNAKTINVVKIFDKYCLHWKPDTVTDNVCSVKYTIEHCNLVFRARGYLFLNEVYIHLGMPRTKQGHNAGWIYDEQNCKEIIWSYKVKNDGPDIELTFKALEDITHVMIES